MLAEFIRWFNFLAEKTDKPQFRSQREAIDFVRRVTNESGGPNAKILKMRKDYVAVLKEKKARASAGNQGDPQPIAVNSR